MMSSPSSQPERQDRPPLAYLNGEIVPFHQAQLPVYDLGVMQGATVTERLRTVHHRPYLIREHLDRLEQSLACIGCRMPLDMGPMGQIINDLARENSQGLPPFQDLAIVVFVTVGQSLADSNGLAGSSRPTVCLYTAPLPHANWADGYRKGIALVTPDIRQIPADSISPRIKHRSRLHWYLADHQAKSSQNGAMALLLDHDGHVTETSSGNLFLVSKDRVITPPEDCTLGGIAQNIVTRIAQAQGWPVLRKPLTVQDVLSAEEAFLTSSTYCILPVGELNGERIGSSLPGRVTKMLIDLWSKEIGLDFEEQALNAR